MTFWNLFGAFHPRGGRPSPVVRPREVLVLPEVILPELVVKETVFGLQSFNSSGEDHEGIVYWAGLSVGQQLFVTTCIVPEAETTEGSYRTSALANAEVIALVNRHRIQVMAQIHTHPGAWVDHSEGDVLGAFMPYQGFLSIVVPNYARRGMLPLAKLCGVHLFYNDGFMRLTKAAVAKQFRIVPSLADLR